MDALQPGAIRSHPGIQHVVVEGDHQRSQLAAAEEKAVIGGTMNQFGPMNWDDFRQEKREQRPKRRIYDRMVCVNMLGQQLMDDGGTASRSNRA